MKTPDDNNLDRLFREGLNNPDRNAAFREEDWKAMEELLDEKPHKRRAVIWLYWLSGSIAAVLVLFFGWALFKQAVLVNHDKIVKASVKKVIPSTGNVENKADLKGGKFKKNPNKATGPNQLAVNENKIYAGKNSIAESNNQVEKTKSVTDKEHFVYGNQSSKNNNRNDAKQARYQNRNNINTNNLAVNKVSQAQKQATVLATDSANGSRQFYTDKRSINLKAAELTASQAANNFTDHTTRLAVVPAASDLLAKKEVIAKNKNAVKANLKMPPRLTLAILTAPDVNGVSSFTGSKIGTNAGLQFSVQLTRKWSVNTGATYASKPYDINAQQYQTAATYRGKPGNVAVNCKVLDIPLNLNYQVFSKNRNTFAAGAGLSSYFMLRENYNFYYTDNTFYSRNIINQNKHVLGVLNLNATYQRQVNSNFNLIVQPYLKLPLTPIGYEHINLQSAGIAIGVGWNISPFKNK